MRDTSVWLIPTRPAGPSRALPLLCRVTDIASSTAGPYPNPALVDAMRKVCGEPVRVELEVVTADRVSEDYSVGSDLELADRRVVGARARLEDRHGTHKA